MGYMANWEKLTKKKMGFRAKHGLMMLSDLRPHLVY